MKRNLLFAALLLAAGFCKAQGLEHISVEQYYVSDANDSIANDGISAVPGTLPVGSKTYRIYIDMLPGFKFQAVYGVPGHELRISTTTTFYNNEDRGATTANAISNNYMHSNTVMLDSWLSVGAANGTKYGIMKSSDDGVGTVSNVDGALQNNDVWAGIPLTTQDGLITGSPAPEQVTLVGFDPNELDSLFGAATTSKNVLSTSNTSWASLNGSFERAADSLNNRVLIGQFTTNGDFCFKMHVQIGTPTGGVENYVADSAVAAEILFPELNYCASTVHIADNKKTAPLSLSAYPNPANDILTISFSTQKSAKVDYRIYDVTGSTVMSKSLGNASRLVNEKVNISALPPGLYFVEVSQDGITAHRKIVKN
jgi:hypothetical protein